MIEVTEERKKLLKDDMQRLLKEWQKRLFLQDWIINLEMVDQGEILDKWGENAFNWEGKWCNIRIAYPDEENQRKTIKYLPELTLVHELLHCKMNFCSRRILTKAGILILANMRCWKNWLKALLWQNMAGRLNILETMKRGVQNERTEV